MSKNYRLGEIRRSQVLSYGPGAIIDFRVGEAAVSVVAPGLEFWDEYALPAFPVTKQKISEPRLQKKLNVKGFRLPPVELEKDGNCALPGFRFPQWLQCPQCNRLKYASKWSRKVGNPARWCAECTESKGRPIYVVPARFITSCSNGHLDEFPWLFWFRSKPENRESCKDIETGRACALKFTSSNSMGLSGLGLACEACGGHQSLGNIFAKDALRITCSGKMPWLKNAQEPCTAEVRVMQRGASNLYIPIEESALSIPPWSDAFQQALDVKWDKLAQASEEQLPGFIELLMSDFPEDFGLTPKEVTQEIIRRKKFLDDPLREDLKHDEFNSITGSSFFKYVKPISDTDFKVTHQKIPQKLSDFFSRSIRVDRLKEVRALCGFSRIQQSVRPTEEAKKKLSSAPINWLPAIEVRGEGLFFSLDDNIIDSWAKQDLVIERTAKVDEADAAEWQRFLGDEPRPYRITAKFLLLHSLSHAIMRTISLECGYDTASIRERIYCDEGGAQNNGILLYTSSSDAEGTLGGLSRMSEPDKFRSLVLNAIAKAEWCSSDPLCIKDVMSESVKVNLAACHNCMLVPETSCEEGNCYLDRALLVGTPDDRLKGFFADLKDS